MKTRIQVYQPQPGAPNPVPACMQRAREFMTMIVTGFLRIFGIKSITTTYASGGLTALTDVSFEPFSTEPPENLLRFRNRIVRWLSDGMLLFGMLAVEIAPSDAEWAEIKKNWNMLDTGKGIDPATPPQGPREIQLAVETDPDGQNALAPDALEEVHAEPEPANGTPA